MRLDAPGRLQPLGRWQSRVYNVITTKKGDQTTYLIAPVKTRIIKIGNPRGIRIPKLLLQQLGLGAEVEVELEAQAGQLVIRPARSPRAGWEAAFAEMAKRGDDKLLDDEALLLTEWESSEWRW